MLGEDFSDENPPSSAPGYPTILKIEPQNLERFRQLVLADRTLHEQLRRTSGLDGFVTLAVRLGVEHDCAFTDQEVRAALRECRRAWLERWI
jgi:hypothetical protein